MGFGVVVERFGLFILVVGNLPSSASQRGLSLWLRVALLLIGGGVAIVAALPFRSVVRGLGEKEIPRGYRTELGVWLNFLLATAALALAVHFVWTA